MGCGRLTSTAAAIHTHARRWRSSATALAVLVFVGGSARLAAQGAPATIVGRVTDAGAGTPISGATIRFVGTHNGAQSNEDGRYTVRAVTPGATDRQLHDSVLAHGTPPPRHLRALLDL